jgi:branched-chain amino acid transport system substrate-binding protein
VRRFIIPVAVTATAMLFTAACGSDSGSGSSSSGGSGGTLTIAFPVPLTSGNKASADQMVDTAKLAVKKINSSGGAGGRQLALKVYDDKLTADESAKIAQRAITQDKAEVIMGGYTSIEGLAIREVTERRKVVYMATSTVSPQLTKDATYTFRVAHDQGDYPIQMAALYKKLGFSKPVVVHDDGPSGSTLFGPVNEALKSAGMTPGSPVQFTLNATDVSSAAAEVKKQNPDSIVHLGSSSADAGLMIKTLSEQGINVPVIGFGSVIAKEARTIGGAAYTRTPVYTLINTQPSKPQYQDFVKQYAAEYGGSASELTGTLVEQTVQTWDGFEALRQALDVTKGKTDGDALRGALKGLKPFEGAAGKAGGQVTFADSQNAYKEELVAFKANGSALVAVEA